MTDYLAQIIETIMSVRHSIDKEPSNSSGAAAACNICNDPLSNTRPLAITHCQHTFHKTCILMWLDRNHNCPTCKNTCEISEIVFPDESNETLMNSVSPADSVRDIPKDVDDIVVQQNTGTKPKTNRGRGAFSKVGRPVTRSMNFIRNSLDRTRRESNVNNHVTFSGSLNDVNNSNNQANLDQKQIYQIIQAEQEKTFQKITSHLNNTIEQQLQRYFQNLHISETARRSNISEHDWPNAMPFEETNHLRHRNSQPNGNNRTSMSSVRSQNSIQPEKVSSLIQSWHLKFDGSKDGMPTEEFIYRVEALTKQILNDDFSLLCANLHVLLTGKVNSWYWKFHKRNPQFTWDVFCNEFQQKFNDNLTDLDIWENIRKRRQRENEGFEDYQSNIESLVERLSTDISESDLVEILLRNSKPSLRYELLHLRIHSLARLREEVRRHETFFSENNYQTNRIRNFRPNISEIFDTGEQLPENVIAEIQHKKINIVCWNCDSSGHRYDDCVEPRKIFCYGCGRKETFKPHCKNCNSSGNQKRDVATNTIPSHPNNDQ